MSLHIGAEKGKIAKTVLMPGDPLRAQFIAENFLENAVRYSEIRNMYGYTGTYLQKVQSPPDKSLFPSVNNLYSSSSTSAIPFLPFLPFSRMNRS